MPRNSRIIVWSGRHLKDRLVSASLPWAGMTLDQGVGKAALYDSGRISRCFLGASCLLVCGLTLGLGAGRGAAVAPLGRSRAGTLPCAAPSGRFASVLESSPGHVRWQRAGVTSETPVGLS